MITCPQRCGLAGCTVDAAWCAAVVASANLAYVIQILLTLLDYLLQFKIKNIQIIFSCISFAHCSQKWRQKKFSDNRLPARWENVNECLWGLEWKNQHIQQIKCKFSFLMIILKKTIFVGSATKVFALFANTLGLGRFAILAPSFPAIST